ncbi:AAA family ATPase [Acidithrix sp. C25]|uniref:AAA family ATPase n=1 Tax=Acidithrix sp. C25 TaxID=1671482 RepID=UPI00191BB2C2|nr:AAA family ATPase [Acidithrix sp. C25]CAG4931910.1 unnamed protein product [Acidithrix sp. C25]
MSENDVDRSQVPLPQAIRPQSFDAIVGHETLLGQGGLIGSFRTSNRTLSIILYGPPGSGKTTISENLLREIGATVLAHTGSTLSIQEIKRAIDATKAARGSLFGGRVVLFVDEIHRLSKVQQDALLEPLERGKLEIIGATTENPSFSLSSALLSRMLTIALAPLTKKEVAEVIRRSNKSIQNPLVEEIVLALADSCHGDLRSALTFAEILGTFQGAKQLEKFEELKDEVFNFRRGLSNDSHFELASALIKSMRSGQKNDAIQYLAQSLDLGEDPRFIARRIVIFASEDIGNADPMAIVLATSTLNAVERIGMPEARIILSQAVIYMADAPKSRAVYDAIDSAISNIANLGSTPSHLRGISGQIEERLTQRGSFYRE